MDSVFTAALIATYLKALGTYLESPQWTDTPAGTEYCIAKMRECNIELTLHEWEQTFEIHGWTIHLCEEIWAERDGVEVLCPVI